jgi:hypothetical protein
MSAGGEHINYKEQYEALLRLTSRIKDQLYKSKENT